MSASLLLAPRPAAADPIHIEVALQQGGESEAVFQQIAAEFEQTHPGILVDLETDPRITDKLRVRILEQNFPELTNADFGGSWNLIHAGDIASLNTALDGPCWGEAAPALPSARPTWRASFLPGILDRFTDTDGCTYAAPLSYYAWTIWYNRALFAAHGWQVPRTWDQFLSLCGQVKTAGVAPLAFQGRYAYYGMMFTDGAYYQLAGNEAYLAQKHLRPGGFDNPLMVQALTWAQTLGTQYFQSGAMGMDHTEAQLQFFLGHAAMLPCGSWLKSEMAGKIPAGFQMGTFNIPTVDHPAGDPTALYSDSSYFTVFSHSKHPAQGIEFLRFITSPAIAAQFCRACDIPVGTRGVNETNLSPDLADLGRLIQTSTANYGLPAGEISPEMTQHYTDVLLDIFNGRVTPQRAAEQLESDAAAVREGIAHPNAVPIRHIVKPIVLLCLLAAGGIYAGGDLLRRRRRSPASHATPLRPLALGHVVLFVAPAVLLFLLFTLMPGVKSFAWSLQNWDGLTRPTYVGLLHFKRLLFGDDTFWIALGNNLFIMLVIPALMVPLALFLAACVSRGVRGGGFFRGAFLIPSVMGGVAATVLWMDLYDPQAGIINIALVKLGRGISAVGLHGIGSWFLGFDGFAWLSQDHLYTALVPMSVWTGFGFNFVLYLAAMEAVPTDLYEAAALDGATAWQQFRIVTLPLIWDVLTLSTVFLIIGGMKAFESIWLLTNQNPGTHVHVIGTLMIQKMFTEMHVGDATAIAVVLLGMVFVASVVAMRVMKREAVEL